LMGSAESGDWLVRAPVRSSDEIGLLARAFNQMLAAITDFRAREVERNAEARNSAVEERWSAQLEEKNRIIEQKNLELRSRLKDLGFLEEVTRKITSTLSLEEQLKIITRLISETLGYKEFSLMLLDAPLGLLRVHAAFGFPADKGVQEMTFKLGEGVAGLVAQTGQSMLVHDTSSDSRYLNDKSRLPPRGSLLCVPMAANGQVLGVINVFKSQVDGFKKEEADLIENMAAQAALGISNARLFSETVEQALTDALTSTPNRRALDARLEMEVARATRYSQPVSVLMVDVDHFKTYNDKHGHQMGDGVLREVAQTLCQMVRKTDTVARYGGEEFCLILPGQDGATAREVADKLRKAVRTRAFERGETQPGGCVTVSLGVATFPKDGQDVQTLVDAADGALYAAKRAGRDRVMVAGVAGEGTADTKDAGHGV